MDYISNRNKAIEVIKDYNNLEMRIEHRRLEIMYPYQFDKDENVGGGKSDFGNSETVAKQAISVSNDPMIQKYQLQKKVLDKKLNECDDITFKIINDLMINTADKGVYALSDELGCGISTLYRKREHFIDEVAKLI